MLDTIHLLKKTFDAEYTLFAAFTAISADQASAQPALSRAEALRALRAQRKALAEMARTGEALDRPGRGG